MKTVYAVFELVEIFYFRKVVSDSNLNQIGLAKEVLFVLLEY